MFFTIHLCIGNAMRSRALVKIIIGLVSVVGLWNLLQIESFDNALLQFVTAGVVPGTKIVLSSTQMYILLGVFLVLSFVLIFLKQLAGGVKLLLHRKPKEAAAVAVDIDQTKADRPAKKRKEDPVVAVTIPGEPSALSRLWQGLKPRLADWSGLAWEQAQRLFDFGWAMTRRSAFWTYSQLVRGWMLAEPRIRQLDKKIETKLKSNQDIATLLRMTDEAVKIIQNKIEYIRTRLNRIVEKNVDQ